MSPMVARASAISPPPPSPCSARKAISCAMYPEKPANSEPAMKMMIASWKIDRRP